MDKDQRFRDIIEGCTKNRSQKQVAVKVDPSADGVFLKSQWLQSYFAAAKECAILKMACQELSYT